MNAENERTVEVLKKRFETLQNSKKPVHELEDKRNEKHVIKKNIKRTPAFRRDANISRKFVDHSHSLTVTNNLKQYSISKSSTSVCNEISPTDSHSYKTDKLNQNLISKNDKNTFIANALNQCLKKKLENNKTNGCKSKVPKKDIENSLESPLPVGPPPKKPPRTFAHDKQNDTETNFKCSKESQKKSKSDPKIMLQKLEKFVSENSYTQGKRDKETVSPDSNSKKNSIKSNLFNLGNSLNCMESQNEYDNSLKTYNTDEQNYLTKKSHDNNSEHFYDKHIYDENLYDEHLYDEPIFLKQHSRLNINSIDNCHALIGNEWVCDSDKSNLHYMVSSQHQLKK